MLIRTCFCTWFIWFLPFSLLNVLRRILAYLNTRLARFSPAMLCCKSLSFPNRYVLFGRLQYILTLTILGSHLHYTAKHRNLTLGKLDCAILIQTDVLQQREYEMLYNQIIQIHTYVVYSGTIFRYQMQQIVEVICWYRVVSVLYSSQI